MPDQHAHNHYELMIVLQGKLFVQCENMQYVLSAPVALLYQPLAMHNANADRNLPYERYIVYFTEAVAQKLRRIAGNSVFPQEDSVMPLYLYSLHDVPPDSTEETILLSLVLYMLKGMDKHETPAPVKMEMHYIREVMRFVAFFFPRSVSIFLSVPQNFGGIFNW